jgi:hypothetical protein
MDPDDGNTVPYEIHHINLTIGGKTYSALAAPLHDSTSIASIEAATLQLDDQKNGTKGEVIDHAATTDPIFCPAKALGRIAQCHQQYHTANPGNRIQPGKGKIYKHQEPDGTWHKTANRHVTDALQDTATLVEKTTGIPPKLISARSMRPGGATALLCAGVHGDAIKLVGRWKSDSMLLYLRAQVLIVGEQFAQRMLDNGRYSFAPMALASDALSLPNNVSQDVANVRALFGPVP